MRQFKEKYKVLQREIRGFIAAYGAQSPKTGGGRKRPNEKVKAWQRLLLEKCNFGRNNRAMALLDHWLQHRFGTVQYANGALSR